jgi:ribosomal protein S1
MDIPVTPASDSVTPGRTIRARVKALYAPGVDFEFGAWTITVLLPELAWSRDVEPRFFGEVGDEFDIRVLRVTGPHRAVGSIKQLRPELDPWRAPLAFQVGARVKGEVARRTSVMIDIRFAGGVYGFIERAAFRTEPMIGELFNFVVVEVNLRDQSLRLQLAGEAPPSV